MILQKPIALATRARALLEAVPYSVLILVARAATFSVFFRSGLVKLDDWNATISLFENASKRRTAATRWWGTGRRRCP